MESLGLRPPVLTLAVGRISATILRFILVDSTRAGKRMPDALSKTVPIWCTVVNRAVKATFSKDASWDIALYTPPGTVSAQEHAQIEARLDGWADHLVVSPTCPRVLYPTSPHTSFLQLLRTLHMSSPI